MNVGPSIWDRLTHVVLALLLVATVIGVVLWYQPVVEKYERLGQQKFRLEQQIEEELKTSKKLDASIKSLQDPRTIERLAREKLSYAKPGENVVHFESAPAATNTARAN